MAATSDPVVRSIQIAEALLGRLAEILRPTRNIAGLLAPELAADALDLKLGEAQQITPELWRHLDEARNALEKRGNANLQTYDDLRKLTVPGDQAVAHIEVKRKLDLLGLVQGELKIVKSKSVTWDSRNLVTAILAIATLQGQMPEVDWKELERQQNAEIAAAGSLRQDRMRAVKKAAIGVALLAALLVGAGLLMSKNAEKAAEADPRAPTAVSAQSKVKHAAKIAELKAKYQAAPCDEKTMKSLTAYMFADGDEVGAGSIEDKFLAECAKPDPQAAP